MSSQPIGCTRRKTCRGLTEKGNTVSAACAASLASPRPEEVTMDHDSPGSFAPNSVIVISADQRQRKVRRAPCHRPYPFPFCAREKGQKGGRATGARRKPRWSAQGHLGEPRHTSRAPPPPTASVWRVRGTADLGWKKSIWSHATSKVRIRQEPSQRDQRADRKRSAARSATVSSERLS